MWRSPYLVARYPQLRALGRDKAPPRWTKRSEASQISPFSTYIDSPDLHPHRRLGGCCKSSEPRGRRQRVASERAGRTMLVGRSVAARLLGATTQSCGIHVERWRDDVAWEAVTVAS
ncbi:hypothetical protein OsI_08702 [Oryza sativa Indica Group]|uniref:Uncharacterized protein n=1 Tax=Oryza sativa subsp. indica TaxID=39946 RepID=B8AHM4_ORYSI|nr:hypothetical protein OsI_08702 [Oryza sativa Indica Group]